MGKKPVPLRFQWEEAVRADRRLTHGEARVAWAYLHFWNRTTQTAFPSYEKVAAKCAMTRAGVIKAVGRLVGFGYLVKVKKRGYQGSAEFAFPIPKVAETPASIVDHGRPLGEISIVDHGAPQSSTTVDGNLREEPLRKSANGRRKGSVEPSVSRTAVGLPERKAISNPARRAAREAIIAEFIAHKITQADMEAALRKVDQDLAEAGPTVTNRGRAA